MNLAAITLLALAMSTDAFAAALVKGAALHLTTLARGVANGCDFM